MTKLLLCNTLAAFILVSPSLALAHQTGDIIFRGGALKMDPEKKSRYFMSDDVGKLDNRAQSDGGTQFGLNVTYMFTDYLGIDLLTSTPYTHNFKLKSDSGNTGKLGKVKHLPMSFSLVHFPLGNSDLFQPYWGGGINYSTFYGAKLSRTMKDDDYSTPRLKHAFGVTAQLGLDIDLGDSFMLNAQVRYIKMDTKISANDNSVFPKDKERADWNINPILYMVGFGYKF